MFCDLKVPISVGVPTHAPNVEPESRNLEPTSRPLLKWAGGKRQLLPVLRPFYPARFTRYVEPFFGSGAVFFDLCAAGRLHARRARLVDANPDLVGCYLAVRDRTEEVIRSLEALAWQHRARGDAFYYEVRNERFNPARAAGSSAYTPELAAMLIYLNRTGFNGLFRVNRRGDFNVPAGRYLNPCVCDPAHLRRVAALLGREGVTIELGSFEQPLADAGAGDFVYCDPPYAPLTRTASFASYTAGGFGPNDQRRLMEAAAAAAGRGARVLVSNSSAPLIESLYTSAAARGAGFKLVRVPARRAINSRADSRGPVDELIISNIARLARARPRMARASLRPQPARTA